MYFVVFFQFLPLFLTGRFETPPFSPAAHLSWVTRQFYREACFTSCRQIVDPPWSRLASLLENVWEWTFASLPSLRVLPAPPLILFCYFFTAPSSLLLNQPRSPAMCWWAMHLGNVSASFGLVRIFRLEIVLTYWINIREHRTSHSAKDILKDCWENECTNETSYGW